MIQHFFLCFPWHFGLWHRNFKQQPDEEGAIRKQTKMYWFRWMMMSLWCGELKRTGIRRSWILKRSEISDLFRSVLECSIKVWQCMKRISFLETSWLRFSIFRGRYCSCFFVKQFHVTSPVEVPSIIPPIFFVGEKLSNSPILPISPEGWSLTFSQRPTFICPGSLHLVCLQSQVLDNGFSVLVPWIS